ncbi:MAG: T9SS type A sorting domain-containing protein [Kordia sp.]|uniref:T9SS type A sorting domain-containing protein n=1 Tax=Kordia sp. TaxID=1965332 RepID=UPI00385C5F23
MKKIIFLVLLFVGTFAIAQPTNNATDPPTRDAADVISIFSDTYANVPGSDYNPNWGQSGFGSANTAFDPGTGNVVLAYPNFNYQGNQYGTPQNISAMEFLHVDIWIDGTFNPNVFVISSGTEIAHPITNTGAGTWISVDIPVVGITGDLSNAIQFKFDGGNGSTDGIYVDNLYFWKNPTAAGSDATLSDLQVDGSTIAGFGPGTTDYTVELAPGTTVVPQITSATTTDAGAMANITQAPAVPGDGTVVVTSQNGMVMETYTVSFITAGPTSAAPTPPGRAPQNVISLFSNAYTNETIETWNASFDDSTSEDVVAFGDDVKKITFTNFIGVEFTNNRIDASLMTHFHMDFWTDNPDLVGKVFNSKFSQWGGGASEVSAMELNINGGTSPALATGTWVSIDVEIDTNFSNNLTRDDLAQFLITSNLGVVYVDNIYFHNNILSTEEFTTSTFKTYPNPTNDSWNVVTDNTVINTIQVFDIAGRQVMAMEPKATTATINATTLQGGIYFARISTDKGTSSVKLVKN